MYKCIHCNKNFDKQRSLSSHRCKNLIGYLTNRIELAKKDIIKDYTELKCSVYEISLKYDLSYPKVLNFLKQNNIAIEPRTITERKNKILSKSRLTTMQRYGVENVSKLEEVKEKVKRTCQKKYGTSNGSSSPISKIKHYILGNSTELCDELRFLEYRQKVDYLTNINKKIIDFTGTCYYSGAEISKNKYYNSMFKATIDHKIPIIRGFYLCIPPEDIASVNNIVWCCKILNTYKNTMTDEEFHASGIIERFMKYESHLRNQTN